MMEKLTFAVAVLLAMSMLGNGVYMMAAPESWYWLVPGVSDRGPFNQHFVRDIGICYALIGTSFAAGIPLAGQRLVLWLLPTLWLAGHAVLHVVEVLTGVCGPHALVEDFAGVTLPALLGAGLIAAATLGAMGRTKFAHDRE